MSTKKTWHDIHLDSRKFGQRLADSVANRMGSWVTHRWDPYPFILLNLVFSTQAAYAAPIIMMAQNRQNDRDRAQADADYKTNCEAKEEIEDLQKRLTVIEVEKLDRILQLLNEMKVK